MSADFDHPRPGPPAPSDVRDLYSQYSTLAMDPPPAAEPRRPEYQPTPLTAMPVVLFLATCYTTTLVGGLAYSVPLLVTLLCHEFGHFVQMQRYRVPSTWPLFIPIPFPPLGTMGAVIAMRGHAGNRRALFDIGISGPLAGLIPALIFSWIGLQWSFVGAKSPTGFNELGEPLLFQWLAWARFGTLGPGQEIYLHPMAYAGWVGIFITALNLIPIGQLDGGHILYAMLRQRSYPVAQLLLLGAVVGVVITANYGWTLMLLLLMFVGPKHPPTGDDSVPLGRGRVILGWLTLLFMVIGFTPRPFM